MTASRRLPGSRRKREKATRRSLSLSPVPNRPGIGKGTKRIDRAPSGRPVMRVFLGFGPVLIAAFMQGARLSLAIFVYGRSFVYGQLRQVRACDCEGLPGGLLECALGFAKNGVRERQRNG